METKPVDVKLEVKDGASKSADNVGDQDDDEIIEVFGVEETAFKGVTAAGNKDGDDTAHRVQGSVQIRREGARRE